ncbi:hypothetical protein, partial [Pseudonocardia sp. ICBG1142]
MPLADSVVRVSLDESPSVERTDDTPEPVEDDAVDVAGEVRTVTTDGWPEGYVYGATRYADVILREAFPERFSDLVMALDAFRPTLDELRAGGGGR